MKFEAFAEDEKIIFCRGIRTMKKCCKCQALQVDSNRFCSECGSAEFMPVDQQGGSVQWQRGGTAVPCSKKNKKPLVLAGIAAVIVIALVVIVKILFNPVDQIMNNLEKDDFAKASSIYQER